MSGITATGFDAKPLDTIKSEIEAAERLAISPTLNTSSASVIGQVNGIMAAQIRTVWELAQAVYNSFFTDTGSGRSLTLRAALTGTVQKAATKTRVLATVNVNPGTYAAGTLIASVASSPNDRFSNVDPVVNSGTSAANVAVNFDALVAGPTQCNASTLTVIAQAVTGWNSVTNAAAGTVGIAQESDAALRLRREQELRASGSTSVTAIRAAILRDVAGVLNVGILENVTNVTDGNGVPPNSIEAIVYGPASPASADDQAVAAEIFARKAAGIGTNGTTTKIVVDGQGTSHNVSFTRPATLPVYVQLTVLTDPNTFAGAAAVQAAVAASPSNLGPGDTLDWRKVVGTPYAVAGVKQVTAFGISTAPGGPFAESNVVPTVRQLVTMTAANVTVTVT